MKRRKFVQTLVVATAGTSLVGLNGCVESTKKPQVELGTIVTDKEFSEKHFPQSILSAEPRAHSILFWTRLHEPELQIANQELSIVLQVSKDADFQELKTEFGTRVKSDQDGCVTIKVKGLESDTKYYYRFLYIKDGKSYASKLGRTRTAPLESDSKEIKFAQVCCQDFIGRYYNSYLPILEEKDLDFVLFLGDYIYETTRDPRFQTDDGRSIQFVDQENAIQLGAEGHYFYSANSLDNYRQLYKEYRSDPILQKVHENFPMIAIWDDHEFADDSFGINTTNSGGRKGESSLERKKNSEQAFFEYMPIDLDEEEAKVETRRFELEEKDRFPHTQIYRKFNFGKNLDLTLTDYRSHRPDHLIAEDSFPGTIILNQTAINFLLSTQGINFEEVKEHLMAYVDIDDKIYRIQKAALVESVTQAYLEEGIEVEEAKKRVAEKIVGNIGVPIINQWLKIYNDNLDKNTPEIILLDENVEFLLGFSYALLGKIELFGEIGSRYFVVKSAFDLFAAATYAINPSSQNALGNKQELWLKDTLYISSSHWKVLANSVSMNSMILDLSNAKLAIPEPFNQKFYMNLDHWDGFPNKRESLMKSFSNIKGMTLLSGDIHASLVGKHDNGIYEFTAPSISSSTQKKMISDTAKTNTLLAKIPKLDNLLEQANELMLKANPKLEFAEMAKNGACIIQVQAHQLVSNYYLIPESMATKPFYENPKPVLDNMQHKQFIVKK